MRAEYGYILIILRIVAVTERRSTSWITMSEIIDCGLPEPTAAEVHLLQRANYFYIKINNQKDFIPPWASQRIISVTVILLLNMTECIYLVLFIVYGTTYLQLLCDFTVVLIICLNNWYKLHDHSREVRNIMILFYILIPAKMYLLLTGRNTGSETFQG